MQTREWKVGGTAFEPRTWGLQGLYCPASTPGRLLGTLMGQSKQVCANEMPVTLPTSLELPLRCPGCWENSGRRRGSSAASWPLWAAAGSGAGRPQRRQCQPACAPVVQGLWGDAHCPTGLVGRGMETKEKALLKSRVSVLHGPHRTSRARLAGEGFSPTGPAHQGLRELV